MAWLQNVIVTLGLHNLFRMAVFLIGADLYGLRAHLRRVRHQHQPLAQPHITVLIPARNEQGTILNTIKSVFASLYPLDKIQVVVVTNGSTDATAGLVRQYIFAHPPLNLLLIDAPPGKAHALNLGLRYATGELTMCLDADSVLKPDAIPKVIPYFQNSKVQAVAANIKILPHKGTLNLIQRYEYLVSYQLKRAQTLYNIEYIIGGIGSTFRTQALRKIGGYDTDTVTEDIDLTLKILRHGNKQNRVVYASDVIALTDSVPDLRHLIRQRFRWKWGRYQTFFKNRHLFFNRHPAFSKAFTFWYLPYTLVSDLTFFLEPVILSYLLYVVIHFQDLTTFLYALAVSTVYLTFNILAEDTLSLNEKLHFILLAPIMYLYFYILSFVEYVALLQSWLKLPSLTQSLKAHKNDWHHVPRHQTNP